MSGEDNKGDGIVLCGKDPQTAMKERGWNVTDYKVGLRCQQLDCSNTFGTAQARLAYSTQYENQLVTKWLRKKHLSTCSFRFNNASHAELQVQCARQSSPQFFQHAHAVCVNGRSIARLR